MIMILISHIAPTQLCFCHKFPGHKAVYGQKSNPTSYKITAWDFFIRKTVDKYDKFTPINN